MRYTHTQAAPSTNWEIVHNMDGYPAVDVIIDNDGARAKVLPRSVEYINNHSVMVRFSIAVSGIAVLEAPGTGFTLNTGAAPDTTLNGGAYLESLP